ncbi:MAG: ankyrin repeat domain-containing protein [Acidobacteria bacterium]|nr:ankyrin repeat domain-containing protein [Acidobacteriota bacterium]
MRMLLLLVACLPVWAKLGDALLDAARSDDRAAVAALIAQKAELNAREADGTTALGWAAARSNTEIASLLLNAGADPNLANELGIGPLMIAITNGAGEMVKLLLSKGANPNVARENGETPLMTAARLGQVETLRLLLDRGASLNARDKKFGQTALMWAAGNPAAVRLLVERGADVKAVTASWDVKYVIYAPTTATLGKTGIPWNTDGEYVTKKGGQNALFFAVQKHDVESARILMDAGIDVNAPSADGTTPLLAALYNWDPPNTVFVPGKGAPAQAGSSQKFGADLKMAALLLDRGAAVKVRDGAGYTPLHGAVLAVANASLGASARRGGAYGRNPALLTLSATKGSDVEAGLAIVARLLEKGADPNQQTQYPTAGPAGDVRINPAPPGSSAMHVAGASTNLQLVKMLVRRGGNVNQLRKDGHTPFSVAVMAGNVDVVKEMIARGADLQARYNPAEKIPDPVEPITIVRRGQSILHIAALGGSVPMVEFLVAQGARLDVKNELGETPYDLADQQERYRQAIQIQNADGDAEKIRAVVRPTEMTAAISKLRAGQRPAPPAQK